MFTSSSLLGNKVWFLKMNMGTTSNPNYQYSQVMNKLTNQSGMYPGWNADEQYIRITNYTDTTGGLVNDLTNDCRNAMKYRIVYSSSNNAFQIKPICSFNGYYRVLDIINNGADFASGQKIDTFFPLSLINYNDSCQWFVFRSIGNNKYSIHVKSNINLVLSRNSNNRLVLAEYDYGNLNQTFLIQEADGYNTTGYVNYNTLENYYRGLNWAWPHATKNLTSSYGFRNLGGDEFHQGIDSGGSSSVYAVNSGEVLLSDHNDSRGNFVILKVNNTYFNSSDNICVVYQHLATKPVYNSTTKYLSKGDFIANSGSTGYAIGSHLHFTVLNYEGDFLNELYLNKTLNPLLFYSSSGLSY